MNGVGYYTQKTEYGNVQKNVTYTDFTNGHIPIGANADLYSYEVVNYTKYFLMYGCPEIFYKTKTIKNIFVFTT